MKIETKIKLTFWHLATLTLSFWFWMYIDYVLNIISPESWRFDFEPSSILTFLVLVTITSLGYMMFHDWRWTMTLFGVNALMFLAFFGFTWLNLLGVAIAVLMNLDSFRVVSEELRERTKINPGTTLRRGLTGVVVSSFLLISFAAYQSPVLQSLEKMDHLPSGSIVFIQNIVEGVVSSQFGSETEASQELVTGQVTNDMVSRLNTVLAPYFRYAPPILSFALFLVLWGVSWLFIWLGVWLGTLGYAILKKMKFFEIKEEDIKAEKLVV